MRRVLLALWVGLAGCGPPAVGWVPEVVLRGELARERGASAWDWRVDGALRWQLGRAGSYVPPAAPPVAATFESPLPCLHPAICAWERRERGRAYEAALRRLTSGGEEP